MKTHDLTQGTPEWSAHRATHFNASDAPAMLGCSQYKKRSELLAELATGAMKEIDAETQRRFDDGHRFEALARPLAEEIIGEDLFPVTGSEDFGLSRPLSASFDGLTFMEDTAFEHKSLNDDLRAVMVDGCAGADLPKMYRVQMEQQCMVSGATRVHFMASKWAGEVLIEKRECWYTPDAELRAEIIAGWKQFEADLVNFTPTESGAAVVAAPVTALPAVAVHVDGQIVVRENFKVFEAAVLDFLEHKLIREPKTDQDFADLDLQIKEMKNAEAALDAAEVQMLAQIAAVDSAKKTKDMLAKLVRDNRLMAEKLLVNEKERRRTEILMKAKADLVQHIDQINKTLGGKIRMPEVAADFAGMMKGKRTITTLQDAADTELARAKIEANQVADRIRINLELLRTEAAGYETLFMDAQALVTSKAEDDLRNLVKSRIGEHNTAEQKRLDDERAKIRAEEEAKAQREAQAEKERELQAERERMREEERQRLAAQEPERKPVEILSAPALPPVSAPAAVETISPEQAPTAAERSGTAPTLSLGAINARIAPLKVDAAGLAELGFEAVTIKAAKLFHEHQFPAICIAIGKRLRAAMDTYTTKEAA